MAKKFSSEVLKITFSSNFFNEIDQEKKSITFYDYVYVKKIRIRLFSKKLI